MVVNRVEIKQWAKEKINGHIWEILLAVMITSIVTNLTFGQKIEMNSNGAITVTGVSIPLGMLFYFVEVGLIKFMTNFIKEGTQNLKDLFSYKNNFARIFITGLIKDIFVTLWCLLLIIPGIIKAYAYSLVSYLLADEKYKDLSHMELLKKSEEMMNTHKMDLFVLQLSYIGWHILAIFTLGLLEIWIIPYQKTAEVKFLNDIKEEYEKK